MAKGTKTGGGRRKGIPNKVTAEVREAIQTAFVQLGGAEYLVRVGEDNPPAFCKLLGMTLPKDVNIGAQASLLDLIRQAMRRE